MNAQELTLNIAVNLGRLSRWAQEGKTVRIVQFLDETEGYVNQLEKTKQNERFIKTFQSFRNNFIHLKATKNFDEEWAESMLTWANILTHRAKLA